MNELLPELVLHEGHERMQAFERRVSHAKGLIENGVTFGPLDRSSAETEAPVLELLEENIEGHSQFSQHDGGLVAMDSTGSVIGVVVVGAAQFDTQLACFVRFVVVAPSWRGKGVGLVMLGMLDQIFGRQISLSLGNCSVETAEFYQRAGFTVLKPHVDFPFPLGRGALMRLDKSRYPCWFFRSW